MLSTVSFSYLWDLSAVMVMAQDKKGKGKAPAEACVDADSKPGLDVLLELLGKSLCKRSSAHLEAALNCLEVWPPKMTLLLFWPMKHKNHWWSYKVHMAQM